MEGREREALSHCQLSPQGEGPSCERASWMKEEERGEGLFAEPFKISPVQK